MSQKHTPMLLIILDGFGYRCESEHNAIAQAKTPVWDQLIQDYPHTLISASGLDVGLPDRQMGNSEVGHMNIGAGRVVYQDLTRIDKAIHDHSFKQTPLFLKAIEDAKTHNKTIHLMGLLSPGGVHSHEDHFYAFLELAQEQGFNQVMIHAFLDGRDTPPKSAEASLQQIEKWCHELQCGTLATMIGRYYAMDRDHRWDRVQQAYDLLTQAKADYKASSVEEAITNAYARGETDEFVKSTLLTCASPAFNGIEDGDSVIFMNFRSDRARQLSRAFLNADFDGFERHKRPKLTHFISMTQYASDIPSEVAFPPQPLNNVLGEYLSNWGLRQYRIAETEKYAHVTFFFNGGREQPFNLEDRELIASPKVATYDLKPEMSAYEVTDALVKAIRSQEYDFMVCNYANPDMVGHTGNLAATVKAIETIDDCLGRVLEALKTMGVEALITADHGNAECMFDTQKQQPHTAHTNERIPLVYIGRNATFTDKPGVLADIAPTLLYLMNIPKPKEMTGNVLLTLT